MKSGSKDAPSESSRPKSVRVRRIGSTVVAVVVLGVAFWVARNVVGRGFPIVPQAVAPANDFSVLDASLRDLAEICVALPSSRHPALSLAPLRDVQARYGAGLANDRSSDAPALHLTLAEQLAKSGDLERAFHHIDQAAQVTPPIDAGDRDAVRRGTVILLASAVARLRATSVLNCPDDPEACTLGGGGGTRDRSHAQEAIRNLEALLALNPEAYNARWLLNMAHARAGSYPDGVNPAFLIPPETFGADATAPRFVDKARTLGVAPVSVLGASIMDDFDNDGFLDLFTTAYDPCAPAILFRNRGDGRFTDRSTAAGLTHQLGGFNAVQTDYNNDGFLDVLILRGAWQGDYGRQRNSLLRNNGDGSFRDVTDDAGLAYPAYPTQAGAWADYDGDGDLDLFVGNEAESQTVHYPSQLFRNNGDGTFTDAAQQAGVVNDRMAKGVTWGDYDNDGDPDLYVSNIGANRLYRNNNDGTFTDVAEALGVEEPTDRSFVPWFWDFDNDGWLDIYVAGYSTQIHAMALDHLGLEGTGVRPRLYRNDGLGGFEDVTEAVGLYELQLPMGANFGDIDNDGWLDIYLGTGDPGMETVVPNVMYRNENGERFVDVTMAAGVGHLEKGHGIAFGDIDHDGDQDIYLQAGGFNRSDQSPNALYVNPGNANHWITINLRGTTSNRPAIGARLALTVRTDSGTRRIYAEVSSGGSFGASSLRQEIGLGTGTRIDELAVTWPGGRTRQVFRDVAVDQFIEIEEGVDTVRVVERPAIELRR